MRDGFLAVGSIFIFEIGQTRRPLTLLLLGLVTFIARAQGYPIHRYSTEDGLPQFTVRSLMQDRAGYLWIGTQRGLVRFDGHKMVNPVPELEETVTAMEEGASGIVWLATRRNLYRLESQVLTHITELDFSDHYQLAFDDRGRLWFAGPTSGYLTQMGEVRISPSTRSARYLTRDPSGRIQLAGEQGIWWQDEPISSAPGGVVAILARDGETWLATSDSLFVRRDDRWLQVPGSPGGVITCLSEDREHNLWVGTTRGAYWSAFRDDVAHMKFVPLGPRQGLSHPVVHQIMQDREGNIWFATEIGLCRLPSLAFTIYDQRQGLLDNSIWAIEPDADGAIWFGTNQGVSILARDGYRYLRGGDELPRGEVRAIAHDGSNHWLGTSAGLVRLDARGVQTISTSDSYVRDLLIDERRTLWVATNQAGIDWFSADDGHPLGAPTGLPHDTVFALAEGNSHIYAGTSAGLAVFEGRELKRIWTEADSLPGHTIFAVEPRPDGQVWVGTTRGLARIDGERVERFDTGAGDGLCYFIKTDREGAAWVGSNFGVSRLEGDHFRLFTRRHGLPFDEMNIGAVHLDTSGRLWLGTYDGAALVDISRLRRQETPLLVHIEQWSAGGIHAQNGVALPHGRNDLKFQLSAPHFTMPASVRFRYRLEGLDHQWQETGEPLVRYPSLPPGTYHFRVSARTRNDWGPETELNFHITAPFWQEPLFMGALAVLIVSLTWLSVGLRRQNRRLGKQVALERATTLDREAELRLLHAQMNPHFLQNALNNAIYFADKDGEKTSHILRLLSGILRQAFKHSVAGVTTLGKEIEMVSHYLEIQRFRFGERLRFTLDLPEEMGHLKIPCFVIQPLVENAVVHGSKQVMGELEVRCSCRIVGQSVEITVRNNGRPLERPLAELLSEEHALGNIDKRLNLLYQTGLTHAFEDGCHHFKLVLPLESVHPANGMPN